MTKELVEEAKGRPKEEQAVIQRAKDMFSAIKYQKIDIEGWKKSIEKTEKYIKDLEADLELLRQGKYTFQETGYGNIGLEIIFKREEKE